MEFEPYHHCTLCPRNCGTDRRIRPGYCGMGSTVTAARAGLHYYEEPFLSGENGSGTVFFTGCSLGCIYCQNGQISRDLYGIGITTERLAEIFLEQQGRNAHNLNLVTGTHFTPSIAAALKLAKAQGLRIPVVWNSSGYETTETLRMLEGLVDIFLPDFKTLSEDLGWRYMKARDYPERAKEALACMAEMTGPAVFEPQLQESYEGEQALMKRGVVVRHLVIPGQTRDSREVLRYLFETYGHGIWISLMSQYTPVGAFAADGAFAAGGAFTAGGAAPGVREVPEVTDPASASGYPELCRTLTSEEYDDVVDYAIELGIEHCMIQEEGTASDSFIPLFDGTGILR